MNVSDDDKMIDIKEKVKNWTIVVLLVLSLIFFLRSCEKPVGKNRTIYMIDTVKIHTRDTVWAKDTTFVLIGSPIVVDSIPYFDSTTGNLTDYIRTYKDTIEDTNLVVFTEHLIKGTLLGSGMSYKLKIPLVIYDSTTTTIKIIEELNMGLYGGLESGYKTFSPYLDLKVKRWDFGASYDIYNKTPKVRVGYRILAR
tara:strand:- start:1049 stop:1639 length:591 start_codon:yes stop_codon:yes gene_type:complete